MKSKKRIRGTAVVERDSKILLVRDKGDSNFSLPGGGLKSNETAMEGAIRELFEECNMRAISGLRIPECDYQGHINDHQVCLIQSDDDPKITTKELEEFTWWDFIAELRRYPHVDKILNEYKQLNEEKPKKLKQLVRQSFKTNS